MEEQSSPLLDYQRIEKAIRYIGENYKRQPSLREIADHVALSEYHFTRLFSRWAGTSPQRFMRYLTKEFAKEQLVREVNLFDATYASGLSSPSRLHDLFVTYEAMTPAEYKAKGEGLTIRYAFHETPFGECLLALTERGITDLRFVEEETRSTILEQLRTDWHNATWQEDADATLPLIQQIFYSTAATPDRPITMLLRGTNFQIKVWEALLRIPFGKLVSYDHVAQYIEQPTAQRAVGTAIGSNRIAYLIPCHRVLQKVGGLGGYRWGTARKQAMLGWEAVQTQPVVQSELDLS
ncbi:methylated-DNA--[protein]-cysteine S-methyltransferase [Telluribacter sp. SYSU D00476]|uniref:methylated-DNA--[protein]-cysteine S-methyltransferase n=1 Tax=Telluribacter sp. SYSU D00476 TaxID=2811430 RepID=UPI001FF41CA5|nr:methylated-DNA--[protein]-cysteine S-methyltransferase [Telluribacter sp. SYSU D00476]